MKSAAFDYLRPATLDAALAMLSEGEDRVILAGGQSLVPALNLRLQAPEAVIDINHIPGLDRIELVDGMVEVGALVRHADMIASPLVARHLPLVALALDHVAHPAIRNRGTTCGSLAYGDPAAEMPACAVALDAVLVLAGPGGRREVAARDFYHGLYETARQPDEILVAARFPCAAPGTRAGFAELARRKGDFATAGVAAQAVITDGAASGAVLVAFASEPAPLVCAQAAAACAGPLTDDTIARVAEALAAEVDPMESPAGTPEMRRRQYRALVRRALTRMALTQMEDADA